MKKVYAGLIIVLITFSTALFYVNLKSPIKIVLLGDFEEERYSFTTSSIIAGRIAEKEVNDRGGIRGRSTELIVRNDKLQNPEETIQFLKKNKVEAVITTAASQELLKLKPYLEQNKIVCIAVGATSTSLSGQEDYIYKILPDDEREVKSFFSYMSDKALEKNIVLIYDKSNLEYKNSVQATIEKLGGKVVFEEGWEGDSLNFTPSNPQAIKDKPILLLSSARHTGFILQKLKAYGIQDKLYGTSWSGDEYLTSYGGRAAEGFTFITPVDFNGEDKDSAELSQKLKLYEKTNGLIPDGVYKGYKLLETALEERREKHLTLREALNNTGYFDKYGDSKASEQVYTVKQGEFVKLKGGSYEGTKN